MSESTPNFGTAFKTWGGWVIGGLAVLYAASASSPAPQSEPAEAYLAPAADAASVAAEAAAAAADAASAEPVVPVPTLVPTEAVAGEGWYDPRYVRCVEACDTLREERSPNWTTAELRELFGAIREAQASQSTTPSGTAASAATELATLGAASAAIATIPDPPAPSSLAFRGSSAPSAAPAPAPSPVLPTCAENGSCYGDLSTVTGRPKTVPVQGYYRKDGTYVRGHYRSR